MADQSGAEDRIQSLANILSLVAIIGGMDKAAVQRVLVTLGSNLVASSSVIDVKPDLAARLLAEIAKEDGEATAMRIASDMDFVARSWKPVLDQYNLADPHRLLPYAEIIFSLFNCSGYTLNEYDVFKRFGGPDRVLAMPQLTAALKTYPVPRVGLVWEFIGFEDPPDHAVIASDADAMFLFKLATSHIDLRFSELERNSESDARQEHDVRIDAPLFAAMTAGLLGDMLYWAARLRADSITGQQTWKRIQAILTASSTGA